MKSLVCMAVAAMFAFATASRADNLSVMEACLKLTGVFEDASFVFSDDHNPDQKVDVLSRLHQDYRVLAPLVSVAGGQKAKAIISNFNDQEGSAITGDVFVVPVSREVAQCKLPNEDKHTCGPMFALLSNTASALRVACIVDYQKVNN